MHTENGFMSSGYEEVTFFADEIPESWLGSISVPAPPLDLLLCSNRKKVLILRH